MKLGIGARITAVFGLGALILSILMGGLSYFTVRHFLLGRRESADQHQTFTNTVLVRTLAGDGDDRVRVLPVQYRRGDGRALRALSRLQDLRLVPDRDRRLDSPGGCAPSSSSGTAATQTYRSPQGTAEIVIGVPIPSVHVFYFDVFDLSDLDHTLRVLGPGASSPAASPRCWGSPSAASPAPGRCGRWRRCPGRAGAIAGGRLDAGLDGRRPIPTSKASRCLSTPWSISSRSGSSTRQFNSDVSHELRSPLTTLAAALEVLEADRRRAPGRSQRAFQLLERRPAALSAHGRRPARDVRGPRPARSTSSSRRCGVAELVQRAVEAGFAHMVSAHGQRRHPHGGGRSRRARPRVVGVDKRRSERVMVNLMANADRYGGGVTAPGPARGRERRHRRQGDLVEVIVDDAGSRHRSPRAHEGVRGFSRGSESGQQQGRGRTGRGWGWPSWPSTCG